MRILMFIFAIIIPVNCIAEGESPLFEEIHAADQQFFTAFNSCDLDVMGKIFSKDLEFYHDMSGYAGYEKTMEVTKNNCDRKLGLVRELAAGSMQVFALGDFGAIQKGNHTFCHKIDGKNDCGTFAFLHIWKRQGRAWELHRVVSYGH